MEVVLHKSLKNREPLVVFEESDMRSILACMFKRTLIILEQLGYSCEISHIPSCFSTE